MKWATLLLFCTTLILSCAKPQLVQYKGFQIKEIRGISANEVSLQGTVKVFNPNSYSVKIWSLETDCLINQKPAGHLVLDTLIELPGSAETSVPVSVKLQSGEILAHGIQLLLGGDIPYALTGTAKAGKGKFRWNLPFEHHGTISRKDVQSLF